MIGANIMDTSRCCWKLSSTPHDSTEPAIALQTGSISARLQEEAAWMATTTMTWSQKRSSCFRCAAVFSKRYAAASRRLSQPSMKKRPGKQLPFFQPQKHNPQTVDDRPSL